MKPPAKNSNALLGPCLLAALSGLALASESSVTENPPKGLAASDWHSIRAAYEAGRHAVHRQDNGTLTARNPGQQWRTEFDGKGFTVTPDHGQWTWGLELTGYGERTLLSAPSSITYEGGNISCTRDENLTEWFINDTRGLEQGWTIHQKERGTGVSPVSSNLTLTLDVRGDLQPRVSPDQSSVSFQTSSGGTALTYNGLKAWDADGNHLTVRFEPAGGKQIRIAVEEQNARYPITIDPIAQQAYLKASNTDFADNFGVSVAASGNTVIVGADREDSSTVGVNSTPNNDATDSGAVYVFVSSGGTWTQQAYLKASNTDAGDRFGESVAISGDTLVVGAPIEGSNANGVNGNQVNNSAGSAGAAYIFVRSEGAWIQQAYLKASNTDSSDNFGFSVAASGNTVIVGAYGEDSNSIGVNGNQADNSISLAGAAYIFVRSGEAWTQQAYLKASNTGLGDRFGYSVAISGETAVIGAKEEWSSTTGVNSTPNDSAPAAGAAYVFVRSAGTWTQQAFLKASNTDAHDMFGLRVAISGDTVVVGTTNEKSSATGVDGVQSDNSATNAGAAYVFVRSGGTWTQQAYLKASNTGANDRFGESVAISEDTVVIGANREASVASGVNGDQADNSANSSGAAYIFVRSGGVWTQMAYLKASNTEAGDNFGSSVAASGTTVIVGANGEASNAVGVNGNQENNSAGQAGAAYVFDLSTMLPGPGIAIEQDELNIITNDTKSFGPSVLGSISDLVFTILNTGTADLNLTGTPKVAVSGSADFTVTAQPASPITGPSGSSNFTVRFTPTGSGLKTASLSIPNNDDDENPFIIHLTGIALSFTTDTDGDGLNDASEFNMAALGFNWEVSQPSLVNTYTANTNGAGYFSLSQVQSLNTGTPLIARDQATGKFKLTMDWKKSTNLTDFLDFPAPAGSAVSISPQGDVEFEFPSTDNAAFYRIELE